MRGIKQCAVWLTGFLLISCSGVNWTFDLNTGKYITTVGHPGEDPEAYGSSVPVLDEAGSDVLYFFKPEGIVKYSMDNRFLGSIKMNRMLIAFPLIEDTVMSTIL